MLMAYAIDNSVQAFTVDDRIKSYNDLLLSELTNLIQTVESGHTASGKSLSATESGLPSLLTKTVSELTWDESKEETEEGVRIGREAKHLANTYRDYRINLDNQSTSFQRRKTLSSSLRKLENFLTSSIGPTVAHIVSQGEKKTSRPAGQRAQGQDDTLRLL